MAEKQADLERIKAYARKIRVHALKMTTAAGSGHPGGSLSAADIVASLYFYKLRHAENPQHPDRDRFIMSKGHCCPALYAALAEAGVLDKEVLPTLRQLGSVLQGHPDRKRTPGIEISGGSLGIGFSVGNGMALAAKLDKKKHRVYVMVGDGELQEGISWEAALFAAHYKLSNLVVLVDNNKCQNDNYTKEVMTIEPIAEKFKAFGWDVQGIDGHDVGQIVEALDKTDNAQKPSVIVAETIKGKGVSFIENDPQWHGKALSEAQLEKALAELKI